MAASSEPELAGEFPAASRAQWRELVAGVLGRSAGPAPSDPEAALAPELADGITVQALYTAADVGDLPPAGLPGSAPYVRGSSPARTGWDVRALHADPDPARTNAAALADLAGGVTSLWLRVGNGALAVGDLPAALDGIRLDLAPIALDAGGQTRAAATALLGLAADRDVAEGALSGSLGADPIGVRARTGADADLSLLAELAEQSKAAPQLCLATVDGTGYHDGGASDVQELAMTTAVGVAYLRALTAAGRPVDEALAAIEFRLAVTDEQFTSIAKLRAARLVWSRVAELSGAAPGLRGQRQHAVTSAAMLTRRGPWVNLLRATVAGFAAAVGGADAVTVLPFDHALGRPDELARRLARNTQAILHDESSLGRVLDAGGGSWYLESLTQALAERAWDAFTAIERAGGALAYLDSGALAADLAATRARRDEQLAHRTRPITGVSEFAFLEEQPVTRPLVPAPGAAGPPPPPAASLAGGPPLAPHRYAEPFEALRDRADAAAERPTVFLAAFGPAAAHTARAGFAAALFAAGGIRSVTGTGSADEIVAAFRTSGTRLACLCSSERHYAESGEEFVAALREAGAKEVWLAGTAEIPRVDRTIFAGCDALAALNAAYDVLEVAE
jgi:methylmalonyl-CoA mutase